MNTAPAWFGTTILHHRILFLLVFSLLTNALRADQVQMQNGDRYFGKITTLNTNSLILQSDVLGSVQLPRSKVATIILGTNVVSNVTQAAPLNSAPVIATPNVPPETPASIRQLAAHSNLIQQVQSRYLADAGPEANAKFTELMTGLTTGKLNVNDLRAEARKSLDQVRELKRGLSPDETSSLDDYLSILENFLKETPASTDSPAARATPKSQVKPDKDE